jgi:hypothetical protein
MAKDVMCATSMLTQFLLFSLAVVAYLWTSERLQWRAERILLNAHAATQREELEKLRKSDYIQQVKDLSASVDLLTETLENLEISDSELTECFSNFEKIQYALIECESRGY